MTNIRLAVIGAGHLGKIHTRLAQQLQGVEFVGIVEPHDETRCALAAEHEMLACAHHDDLLDRIDAAVIAAPTKFHHGVAMDLIEAGKHVLIEKPITTSLEEADELIRAAEVNNVVAAVGHVERFNPALCAAAGHVKSPKYIEASRTSGFTFRSTDVGVVLDLMIHDLDAVLALVDSEIVDVQALGITLFGPHEDMVQARITFANGCVANVSASRTSFVAQRITHVYSERAYAQIDFGARKARLVELGPQLAVRGVNVASLSAEQKQHIRENLFVDRSLLPICDVEPPECNPLLDEQQDFCDAIRFGRPPRVTARAGRDALAAAHLVLRSVERHQWDGSPLGRSGPDALPGGHVPLRKAG